MVRSSPGFKNYISASTTSIWVILIVRQSAVVLFNSHTKKVLRTINESLVGRVVAQVITSPEIHKNHA